ncbi:DUF5686 and carboxypeptidase regulatory-like domain-containing protein [Salegentibacter sp. F188]|uniref:DUF5686 and carboxypeptidase regulatory-like domain-containing protein n=1 Tax=Autumnicola patrickiae TaxID=3075591 RepID=A0ABU3DXQ5_9FLAO|nr:DUF5686 and carboxypeptidase regulatory-like domain-containing protein [Salegentibacter sp. F188]MDT0688465.1 DUF5686 and carboxypeptidase regulatory-like domain-containing protein [Salegentibacter sp. F188]
MYRQLILLFLIISSSSVLAQITGKVTDTRGEALSYVNVYTDNGHFGTTTNENGIYSLKTSKPGTYNLIFQFLGYKSVKKEVNVQEFPFELDISMTEETTSLSEVTVDANENPANAIIEKAIQFREENASKVEEYTADFYSRGLWRIKDAPEKILGQEVGDLGGSLDSTRSGIVYLSETISEIAYRKPDDFKEKIIASKVSGDDNGFSLNSAQEAYFSFYQNTIEINSEIVSPIADYAFNYYRYKLEGTFYDDNGHLINKVKVTPKRPEDRVFSGYIYIAEDFWQIFGVDLETTGKAIQVPPIETLQFKQNYKFSEENGFYIQISQTVDFKFSMFGISGDGRFTAVYSNYNFQPDFNARIFGKEVLAFAPAANLKDSIFWKNLRPVPLTSEERNDYEKKDSIQEKRQSRQYLDSIDTERNTLKITDLLTGYNYNNSFEKRSFSISSPILGAGYNTVQGWNTYVDLEFHQSQSDNNTEYWSIFSELNYGLADKRFRINGGVEKKFNAINNTTLKISGGVETAQINTREPIRRIVNTAATLYFERNYMKLYERSFAEINFSQELFNGFNLNSNFSFEERTPLTNSTDRVLIDWDDVEYTSNNPLQPDNFGSVPFEEHQIFKLNISGEINFGQKYMSYPDRKFNIPNEKYPKLILAYEKGFGATAENYNFDQFKALVIQQVSLGNKGEFGYSASGGTFLNAEDIALVDYQHFNGNQTRIGFGSYLQTFNLLPYYALSTNQTYAEGHLEHNFQGWILGKLPLINKLNFNLLLGAHALYTQENKPYSEYSVGIDNLGFGKYRFLRLDYVVSNQDGNRDGAIIFGLKF